MPKEAPLWRARPVAKDFDAALSFLSLIFPARQANALVSTLRRSSAVPHPARDLLRASGLRLLPKEEADVAADLKRIRKGKALSPVLLIRGDMLHDMPLLVADGYHRICASCHYDEKAPIACFLAACQEATRES